MLFAVVPRPSAHPCLPKFSSFGFCIHQSLGHEFWCLRTLHDCGKPPFVQSFICLGFLSRILHVRFGLLCYAGTHNEHVHLQNHSLDLQHGCQMHHWNCLQHRYVSDDHDHSWHKANQRLFLRCSCHIASHAQHSNLWRGSSDIERHQLHSS